MAAIVLLSALAGMGLVRLDQLIQLNPSPSRVWLYGGTAESAMSLLSAVASSAITVAGVVFSATFVTMQLASSQYTPRVVQALSRKWYLHGVLGAFLGNFIFSLIVLRSVRPASSIDGTPEFTPVVAVSASVAYSIVCVGVMIYYIAYGMRSLQPTFLIDSAARETITLLTHRNQLALIQRDEGQAVPLPRFDTAPDVIRVSTPGFILRNRVETLRQIAQDEGLQVRIEARIGTYRLQNEPLLSVWPAGMVSAETMDLLAACIVLGPERTTDQDIEFGFRRVADILLKALSPAINDPTTAEYCMNRLCELLVLFASGPAPRPYLTGSDGEVRVFWLAEDFNRYVDTALGQVRFYIGHDVSLMLYVLDMLKRTAGLVGGHYEEAIIQESRRLTESIFETISDEEDLKMLRTASSWIPTIR
ncbi:MAG: DUF2254 domain-containing protein [Thermomicrobiales bacterium]|nr:DUF2254 domain-containing protein [Thermomicrobiales bacterium]